MAELRTTHRTTVTEDMIDHLGHMNVRFYGVAARAGSDALVRQLGGAGDLEIHAADIYTRHFREQMLGAELEVRSAVLDRDGGSLRLYHELRNVTTDDLAASFVHRLEARSGGRAVDGWPPAGDVDLTEVPEHGRPRSIDLGTDPFATAPSFEDVLADAPLALRHPRLVEADECRPDGSYEPAYAPMLLWGGEPLDGAAGPTLHPGPNGELIGWATLEHRIVVSRLPRRGDHIQSFGAIAALGGKTTHRIMWAYDIDRADLLIAFEVVDVALDTVSRRAVPIPDDLRAHAEERLRAELLPR